MFSRHSVGKSVDEIKGVAGAIPILELMWLRPLCYAKTSPPDGKLDTMKRIADRRWNITIPK